MERINFILIFKMKLIYERRKVIEINWHKICHKLFLN